MSQYNPYNDPRVGHPTYAAPETLFLAKRKMQGWWMAWAGLVVIGLVVGAIAPATKTAPPTRDYGGGMMYTPPDVASPVTVILYVLSGLIGLFGTVALVLAVKATVDRARLTGGRR
ncbi:hypothetical protein [Mycolicibacterium lutetiense]|uniref:Uncharacterized protein involved in exopolysaccharide biosynthesis n=1 Tax=Mycolicibacterium lutetiense TaxID=1641992 RepID=A0ABS4ZTK5_9MYCO|nr:hypothetical protein [Mycolicibacterium lutetiense]MBP2452501.1 uncharacterized protein involved in exopolysaccharide biosynthesis [Mycolicibacterium lutetiense]